MTKRPGAVPTVQAENDFTIVTEWRFAPGAETGWHQHGYPYVVVPMLTGQLLIEGKDGSQNHASLTQGISYARESGVEHNVVNANDYEFAFVEIEFKDRPDKAG